MFQKIILGGQTGADLIDSQSLRPLCQQVPGASAVLVQTQAGELFDARKKATG
jgi:hypothetical protein